MLEWATVGWGEQMGAAAPAGHQPAQPNAGCGCEGPAGRAARLSGGKLSRAAVRQARPFMRTVSGWQPCGLWLLDLSRHAHELGHGDAALLRHLEMEMDSERRGAMK